MAHLLQLLFSNLTILVNINSDELPLESLELLLRGAKSGDETQYNLLEVGQLVVLDQVLLDLQLNILLVLYLVALGTDPRVLEKLSN